MTRADRLNGDVGRQDRCAITDMAVIVPARDEQDEIGGCLRSIDAAVDALREATAGLVNARVVVALDDCRDSTSAVVADFPHVAVAACRHGSVGAARRTGADAALAGERWPTLWLASTDADCRVPIDWLIRMLAHAETGADLVLGTVRPRADLPDTIMAAWLAAHDLGEGHRHVHGANLGIRANSYVDLGGWSPLLSHEDRDLVTRAEYSGRLTIRRPGDMVVTTSSRRLGRTPHGFASYLADLEQAAGEAG